MKVTHRGVCLQNALRRQQMALCFQQQKQEGILGRRVSVLLEIWGISWLLIGIQKAACFPLIPNIPPSCLLSFDALTGWTRLLAIGKQHVATAAAAVQSYCLRVSPSRLRRNTRRLIYRQLQ